MQQVKAIIELIGVNPFIFLPGDVLKEIFKQAGKDRGPIPVKGTINNQPYKQTLVKYKGDWRLYINTQMLKHSPKRIGEIVCLTLEFDSLERVIAIHPKLISALHKNHQAKTIFDNLRPSLRLEIVRYISLLKSEETIDKNVDKAIDFLLGKGRFIGRDKP